MARENKRAKKESRKLNLRMDAEGAEKVKKKRTGALPPFTVYSHSFFPLLVGRIVVDG